MDLDAIIKSLQAEDVVVETVVPNESIEEDIVIETVLAEESVEEDVDTEMSEENAANNINKNDN